jgi:uncharacterized membrane protein
MTGVPVMLLTLGWLALILAAPFLPAAASALVYVAGSLVCHQLPERSFYVGAVQLPVCGRCLGIYVGVVAGAGAALVARSRARALRTPSTVRTLLIGGALPTVVDVAGEGLGLWQGSNAGRALIGSVLGLTIGLVVAAALATLHYERCAPPPPNGRNRPPSHI